MKKHDPLMQSIAHIHSFVDSPNSCIGEAYRSLYDDAKEYTLAVETLLQALGVDGALCNNLLVQAAAKLNSLQMDNSHYASAARDIQTATKLMRGLMAAYFDFTECERPIAAKQFICPAAQRCRIDYCPHRRLHAHMGQLCANGKCYDEKGNPADVGACRGVEEKERRTNA